MTKEEMLEKDFNYWIGNSFSDGNNVTKDKSWFLTTLKKKYIKILKENQKLSNELNHLHEKSLQDDITIEGLKEINAELTEENMKLSERK